MGKVATASNGTGFKRWNCREKSTWAYQLFRKYSFELGEQIQAHRAASKRVYKTLGMEGAEWEDNVDRHFNFSPAKKSALFPDLKSWSSAYNAFDNWVYLNSIVFSSSNLETFMATVPDLHLNQIPGCCLVVRKSLTALSFSKNSRTTHMNSNQR